MAMVMAEEMVMYGEDVSDEVSDDNGDNGDVDEVLSLKQDEDRR